MSIDTHPHHDHGPAFTAEAVPSGPIARMVAASLAAGLVTALVLTLVVFAGASEATITGSMLVAFGAGWALLGLLSARVTNRPQRWTTVPAAAMGFTGLALVVLTPGDAALTAMAWVWPAAIMALAAYVWSQARRHLPRRGRRVLAPVVAVLALASVAAIVEDVTVLRDHHTYVAGPGTTYDVGGHRLYLDCRGQGSPTVVLDNGLGEVAASWARVVAEVGTTVRVCAYDRAGQGWSEDSAGSMDGITAARDLHTLLRVAGEHGPFVLVGHSIGGTYAMTYAARYPQQVAGMVLLDSSSPEQFTAISGYAGQHAVMRRALALAPTLSRFGLGRVVAAVAPSHLPAPDAQRVQALTAGARAARSMTAEWSALPEVFEQAQALTTLGDRPLVVLTASESRQQTGGWDAAQDRLAALSSRSTHRVVDSTHAGQLEDEHGAAASARAIEDVIASVRSTR